MRLAITICLVLLALGIAPLAQALPFKDGKVVQGQYNASGSTAFAKVKVRYGQSRARVNHFGRISGTILKTVFVEGERVSRSNVKLRGTVKQLNRNGTAFSAPTIIRLGDGAVARGKFRGLVGKDRRLSRYFSGKIAGVSNGRFVLSFR